MRVVILDGSDNHRKQLRDILNSDSELEVVGDESDAERGVRLVVEQRPDVVVMDILLETRDGVWALSQIMEKAPTPVVVFSQLAHGTSPIVEEMFQRGALDFVNKPERAGLMSWARLELIDKIKTAARVHSVFSDFMQVKPRAKVKQCNRARFAVAVVASAGSPAVLMQFIKEFSQRCPKLGTKDLAVLVSMHMPERFLNSYIEAMTTRISWPVRIAQNGDIIEKGRIYFSPHGRTLCLAKTETGIVAHAVDAGVTMQPHFDSFLTCVGRIFGPEAIGVVLSGMGDHGLKGAREMKQQGALVMVQDPATAGVPSMPDSVLKAGLADESLNVIDLASRICQKVTAGPRVKAPVIKLKESS